MTRMKVVTSIAALTLALGASACEQMNQSQSGSNASPSPKPDATQSADKTGEKVADATKNAGKEIAGAGKDIAGAGKAIGTAVAGAAKTGANETSAYVTDAWITTKVTAKIKDEKALDGSHVNVDTAEHVVTLKGTVSTKAARAKAEEIAKGTKGVTKVINKLEVK